MTENRDYLGLLDMVLNEGNRHKEEIVKLFISMAILVLLRVFWF